MKRLVTFIGVAIAWAVVCYLFGAFVAADFDIRQWAGVGRFFVAVAYLFGLTVAASAEVTKQ